MITYVKNKEQKKVGMPLTSERKDTYDTFLNTRY